jgi:hypothetical protein
MYIYMLLFIIIIIYYYSPISLPSFELQPLLCMCRLVSGLIHHSRLIPVRLVWAPMDRGKISNISSTVLLWHPPYIGNFENLPSYYVRLASYCTAPFQVANQCFLIYEA